ncbi:forkhead box protein P1-like isoform X2 [Planococcus citri]|uniref:forkhead box protein P1-like isoform X2 n=1 Tax=Planococcus citri TaxID=170843 RepID=UPI0031F8814C
MHQMPDQHRLSLPPHASQFLNPAAMRRPNFLQQMAIQQQQLVHHLQMSQRQYMLQHGIPVQPDLPGAQAPHARGDFNGLWNTISGENQDLNQNTNNENALGLLASMCLNRRDLVNGNGTASTEDENHEGNILYGSHGVCRWPSCETVCEDYQSFLKHLNTDHCLDDRSTAQARVQAQVVNQLELQLQSERDRLNAMMQHLHMFKQEVINESDNEGSSDTLYPARTNGSPSIYQQQSSSVSSTISHSLPVTMSSLVPLNGTSSTPHSSVKSHSYYKSRRMSDTSGGLPYMLERAGLDVQQEINRNREFYRSADVRPPFTYASLIRQSIIESPDKQLTLNEIYNWFQNTFCYFRRNAATWKNAIRTNLSLHKCFVRYEDDFGSFWMVDDAEFVKRRHLSRGRPRKYDPISSPTQTHHSAEQENQSDDCPPYSKNLPFYGNNSINNNNTNSNQNILEEDGVSYQTYGGNSGLRINTPSPKRMKTSHPDDSNSFPRLNSNPEKDHNSNKFSIKKEYSGIDFNYNTSLESSRNTEEITSRPSSTCDNCDQNQNYDIDADEEEEAQDLSMSSYEAVNHVT